ncbi:MAG TPA: RluA family pseudouridine synthase [Thermoanaerobaculia bacterium]|jgi:RluA family pseudouridine synthase|nr:RluA family pseudouridine synthase [Thermoanaerobaculia bacterium]
MRLDQAVAARYPEISRRKARDLIAQKRVFVNDRPVGVASREVSDRDRITIAEELPDIEVIRETTDWIAVNKPAGIPTQPARDRKQRSLEELLRIRYRTIHLVHRIDTQTSGVVVFAKHPSAAARLSELFASREIRKVYLAVAEGTIDHEQTIETPIGEKDAHTIVRPLRQLDGSTLLEAEILTGRTHQIRIHLKSIERPVVGDRRYGSTMAAPRMLLHAWKLEHAYFGGELVARVSADFPSLSS